VHGRGRVKHEDSIKLNKSAGMDQCCKINWPSRATLNWSTTFCKLSHLPKICIFICLNWNTPGFTKDTYAVNIMNHTNMTRTSKVRYNKCRRVRKCQYVHSHPTSRQISLTFQLAWDKLTLTSNSLNGCWHFLLECLEWDTWHIVAIC